MQAPTPVVSWCLCTFLQGEGLEGSAGQALTDALGVEQVVWLAVTMWLSDRCLGLSSSLSWFLGALALEFT